MNSALENALEIEVRENCSRGEIKKLRNSGMTPGVLYGAQKIVLICLFVLLTFKKG